MVENKELKRRIVDISYKHKLSHLGSCLTAVDIIEDIYQQKKEDEPFILSQGHAGLALYVVLEKYLGLDAEKIFEHHGVHPDRCSQCHLDCSTGSLGQGLPIAVGMALANRERNVWCLISDGECAEGSVYETFNIIQRERVDNLKVYLNWNGWGAYRAIGLNWMEWLRPHVEFRETSVEQLPFLKGLDAHYKVMSEEEYKQALEILK